MLLVVVVVVVVVRSSGGGGGSSLREFALAYDCLPLDKRVRKRLRTGGGGPTYDSQQPATTGTESLSREIDGSGSVLGV